MTRAATPIRLLLCCFVLIAQSTSAQATDAPIPAALARAAKAFEAGDTATLREALRELEAHGAELPETKAALGLLRFEQGAFAEAKDLLAGAREIDEEWRLETLARAAFFTGDSERARKTCEQPFPGRDVLLALLDGPFRSRWPEASGALEATSPRGHYRVVTDLGLDPDELDRLDAKLLEQGASQRERMAKKSRKRHAMLKVLGRTLDQAYRAYDKLFGLKRRGEIQPTVYVFSSEEDFASFSRTLGVGDTENTLGYYLRHYRVMVFYESRGQYCRALPDDLLETLMHETFHQWLHLYVDRAPRWFNEGLAEYFGFCAMTKKKLRYGLVPQRRPSRLSNVRDGLAGLMTQSPLSLQDLLTANRKSWNQSSAMCYAQSWSFVHYLTSNDAGRKLLRKYFALLREGKDPAEIHAAVFGKVDPQRMERSWRAYVGRLR